MIEGDGRALNCVKTPEKKLKPNRCCVDLEAASEVPVQKIELDNKLRCWFNIVLKSFLEEVCAIDNGFWLLPPMLRNGQSVDLLKLFLVVRDKGGFDTVCRNGYWDLVAKDSGFDLRLGTSLKLVYSKYLEAFETWLERFVDDKVSKSKLSDSVSNVGMILMESGAEFISFLSEMSDAKYLESKSELNLSAEVESNGIDVDYEESIHLDSVKSVDFVEVMKVSNDTATSIVMDSFSNGGKKHKDVQRNLLVDSMESVKMCREDEVAEIDGDKKSDNCNGDDTIELESQAFEELVSCRKRKRESMCTMLNWVTGIGRNPCDPVVVSLPESSKWKAYGKEEFWKQVLLVREALFQKGHHDSGAVQSVWQKNQKMHPCMYDDNFGSSYYFRDRLSCSKKDLPGKTTSQAQACWQSSSSAAQIDGIWDSEHSILDLPVEKHIPLGPDFQAEIPEWSDVATESDSKWVGTRVWPVENAENKFIIEREPIGKGRQDSCGCQVPKSIECVRFHSTERKLRMKRELGMAFYHWRFDRMGEEVRNFWTEEEQKKFKAIVRLNPPSLDKCFWNEIFKFFRSKRREDLVSYYHNVFLLQRRAYQNRFTPSNITSDDEES